MKRRLVLAIVIGITAVAMSLVPACKKAPPTPPPLTASNIIDNSVERIDATNSFHFELKQVGGGTPIAMGLEMNEAVGDVARPDKLKTEIHAMMGGMFIEVEIITVGESIYMTNPLTKEWEPLPTQFSAISIFDPDTGIAAILKGMANLIKLEDEEVEGIACYRIRGKISSEDLRPLTLSSVEGVKIDVEVWIDKEQFLLRQIRLEGQITPEEKLGIIRTITLSNFNQIVEIELPK